jgi:hypothetical protein
MMFLISIPSSTRIENQGDEYSPWILDWGNGIDGSRSIRQDKSWLSWFILDEGPDLFWNQWWNLPHETAQNYIRDRATEDFKALPLGLADHQSSLAETLQGVVYAKAPDFSASNPHSYFATCWRMRWRAQAEQNMERLSRRQWSMSPSRSSSGVRKMLSQGRDAFRPSYTGCRRLWMHGVEMDTSTSSSSRSTLECSEVETRRK